MITVDQHISNLLFDHDCVIIPGFGAFVASPVGAQVNKDKHIFNPPGKEIGFNRSLSHNDGLLTGTYARVIQQSYAEAQQHIDLFREGMQRSLSGKETFTIANVGALKLDAIGNVQFTPDKNINYLSDSFGLESFYFKPVLEPVRVSQSNERVKHLLLPLTQKRVAATVALVIGLFFALHDVSDHATVNQFDTAGFVDLVVSKPVEAPALVITEDVLAEEVTVEAVEAEVEPHFFVIAGSFKYSGQADAFLSKTMRQGHSDAFVLASPKGRYRVALKGFGSKEAAVEAMTEYRKLSGYESVWVLNQ